MRTCRATAGRDYATPNIDRIAERGARLTQAYANSAVCSATRLALITGRYQYRLPLGLEEPLAGKTDVGLPPEHPTLPSLLRAGRLRHDADRQMAPGRAAEVRPVAKRLRSLLWHSHRRDRLLLAPEPARRARSVGRRRHRPANRLSDRSAGRPRGRRDRGLCRTGNGRSC